MLAAKAATDSELKSLMRTVASGQASPSQLKVFQANIDELTAALHLQQPSPSLHNQPQRGIDREVTGRLLVPAINELAKTSHNPRNEALLPSGPVERQTPLTVVHPKPQLPLPHMMVEQSGPYRGNARSQSQVSGPEAVFMPGKTDLSAVVFEFVAGSGDRFLFPKFTVLDFSADGKEVLASFLVVRKGSESESGTYKSDMDYFQPVTLGLSAPNAKILDPLARVVASSAETRKHMEDIISTTPRADYVRLALRLPRRIDDAEHDTGDETSPIGDYEGIQKAFYAPPGSLRPLTRSVLHAEPKHISTPL